MRTICIIQARLRSSRLPAKILLPLPTGRVVLQEVVERCAMIPGVDEVVVASPEGDESAKLVLPYTGGARWYDGPEHDVLARYYGAAEYYKADIIVRVTSDCPMVDPELCGQVIRHREQHGQAYSYNNMPVGMSSLGTFPQGLDCEVFTFAALKWHYENADDQQTHEHVTRDLRRSCVGSAQPMNPAGDHSHLRWTLDTIDDYVRICGLIGSCQTEALLRKFRG